MKDAFRTEMENEVHICGRLNELDVKKFSSKGKDYIGGYAEIISDQDICGEKVETRTTVRFMSPRVKKDGNPNKIYDIIAAYPEQFTSIAAVGNPAEASEVSINKAQIKENVWIDQSGNEHSNFEVSGNFLNKRREGEKEKAKFALTGYIFKIDDEMDKNGEPTGRIKVTVGVVGYAGRMNKIEMYAAGAVKSHVEQNW